MLNMMKLRLPGLGVGSSSLMEDLQAAAACTQRDQHNHPACDRLPVGAEPSDDAAIARGRKR